MNKRVIVLLTIIVLMAVLFVAMRYALPLVIAPVVENKISELVNGDCKISRLALDVFAGRLEIENIRINQKQKLPFLQLTIASFKCKFNIVELLKDKNINSVSILGAIGRIDLDSKMNASALSNSGSKETSGQTGKSKGAGFSIDNIKVSNSSIKFLRNVDGRKKSFSFKKIKLDLSKTDFDLQSTIDDDEANNKISISGDYKLDGRYPSVAGSVNIVIADIKNAADVFIPKDIMQVEKGSIGLVGRINLGSKEQSLSDMRLKLKDIELISNDPKINILGKIFQQNNDLEFSILGTGRWDDPLITIKTDNLLYKESKYAGFSLHKISVILDFAKIAKNVFLCREFKVDTMKVNMLRQKNGRFAPLEAILYDAPEKQSRISDASVAASQQPSKVSSDKKSKGFKIYVDRFSIDELTSVFIDYQISEPPTVLRFDKIKIDIQNIVSPPESSDFANVQIVGSIDKAKQGKFGLKGSIVPVSDPVNFDLAAELQDVNMLYFENYYKQKIKMNIDSATLSLRSKGTCVNNQLDVSNAIELKDLSVSPKQGETTIYNLPADTVKTFLVDQKRTLKFNVKVTEDIHDPKISWESVGRSFIQAFVGSLLSGSKTFQELTQKVLKTGIDILQKPAGKILQKIPGATSKQESPETPAEGSASESTESLEKSFEQTTEKIKETFGGFFKGLGSESEEADQEETSSEEK